MARLVSESGEVVVEVPSGETMVGRGPLMKIVDKRVSRNHAALEWKNGNLRLCPKHHNPCFRRLAGESKYSPLTRDKWVELHHGDHIALLPESLFYRVELPQECDETVGGGPERSPDASCDVITPVEGGTEERRTAVEGALCPAPDEGTEERRRTAMEGALCPAPDEGTEEKSNIAVKGALCSAPDEGTVERSNIAVKGALCPEPEEGTEERSKSTSAAIVTSTGKKRALPAWLSAVNVEPKPSTSSAGYKPSSSKAASSRRKGSSAATISLANPAASPPPAGQPPASLGPHPGTGRRQTEGEAGITSHCVSSSSSSPSPALESDEEDLAPPAKRAMPTPAPKDMTSSKLPACPYGADCYRKNPAHFKEYSHDSVSEDDQPECPYGADCYRKNPAHRKNFKHSGPPAKAVATKRTRQTRTAKKKPRVSALAGDSDDSDAPNTYDYTDSFIDDAEASEDSTSYGGESEDSDWAPPTEDGGGGGRGEEGSLEEDVGELVEANTFVTNKKLWQS